MKLLSSLALLKNVTLRATGAALLLTATMPGLAGAAVLLANFDVGNSAASTFPVNPPVGPYGAPAIGDAVTWTKVNSGGGFGATMGGITFQLSNGTTATDSRADLDLLSDYFYQDGSENAGGGAVGNWALSGLTPGSSYQLYFLTPDGSGFGAANVYGGVYGIMANPLQTNNYSAPSVVEALATGQSGLFNGTWALGVNFATFSFVAGSATTTGFYRELAGNIQPHTGIAGLQVALVPEPSVAMLGVTGLLGCLMRRTRRRA